MAKVISWPGVPVREAHPRVQGIREVPERTADLRNWNVHRVPDRVTEMLVRHPAIAAYRLS